LIRQRRRVVLDQGPAVEVEGGGDKEYERMKKIPISPYPFKSKLASMAAKV
jgi:hypothetical protein